MIPLTLEEVEQTVATQLGALMGAAALADTQVHYVKPHGALGNWAAAERSVAEAIARAAERFDLLLVGSHGRKGVE